MKSNPKTALEKKIDDLRRDLRRVITLLEAHNPNRSLSIDEFCDLEGMGRDKFYELQIKPDVMHLGTQMRRISPEARMRWHAACERPAGGAPAIAAE
jgi:hypothetical protein